MRAVLAVLLALAVASPAGAAGAKKAQDDEAPKVALSPIALPVLLNGRVVNYVYVHLEVLTGPGADPAAVRAKEPFLRDAIVRAAHRNPLNGPNQLTALDEPRLTALTVAEARKLTGKKTVAGAKVARQEPKRTRGLPNVKPAA